MNILEDARQGKKLYRITFPCGTIVHFNLLCWRDFNTFLNLLNKGTIPADILEDVVFKECVCDQGMIEQMYEMRAGIVATVASVIMHLSGPAKLEEFNTHMDFAREEAGILNSQIIILICRAFPSYTPEDIESMPWHKVKLRLAQAEQVLMQKNPPEIAEPIRLLSEEEAKPKKLIADDLVLDGSKMNKFMKNDVNSISDLTPEERRQLQQIKEMRSKRRGRRG